MAESEFLQRTLSAWIDEGGVIKLIHTYSSLSFASFECLQFAFFTCDVNLPYDLTKLIDSYRQCLFSSNLYVPLPFWFSHTSKLALPLVSLGHSQVTISYYFENLNNLITHDLD